jgi:CHASE2 domain-containing sensor protein
VGRTLKIVCLAIGLSAFVLMAVLGFAVWVFIPLFPAAIVFLIAVAAGRRRAAATDHVHEAHTDSRKAA